MAMRCLGYVSRTLENLAGKDGLYGEEMVKFPAPEFYCFYIGNEKWESRELRLSEAFLAEPKKNSIELIVNIINLNYNRGEKILQRSPSLLGYSKLVEYIRQMQAECKDLKTAIDTAVKVCISEGFIEDFLIEHSREVTGMLFRELTMEEFAEIRARESFAKGERAGEARGIERGRSEGEQIGLERGAAQKQREIAKNLKYSGISIDIISANTGLSIDEIEKL